MLGFVSDIIGLYLYLGLGLAIFNVASGYKINPKQTVNNGWFGKYIQTDEDNMVAEITYNLIYVTIRYAWLVLKTIPTTSTPIEVDRTVEEQTL